MRVRNVETDLVQTRGPDQQLAITRLRELPCARDLLEQGSGRCLDAHGLLHVHVVAPLHRPNRPLARVLVMEAPEHVVEQPLAQSTVADVETLDTQRAQDLREYCHAAGENRSAVGAETRQAELIAASHLDELLDDGFHGGGSDAALDQAELARNVARRADCPRRTDRSLPTFAPKRRSDRPKLEAYGEARTIETFRTELAVVEVRFTDADATNVQTLEMLRLVALADDELRAAAADVDDEVRAAGRLCVMRNAEIDEARLFDARDHFHRMPERVLGLREETGGVSRLAQRVRANDAHLMRAHVAQALTETPQAS